MCAIHLIQKLGFDQNEAVNYRTCRLTCEEKTDYSNLCMFAIFDEGLCFHYKINAYHNKNQERAIFIPTRKLTSDVRIMFVRYTGWGGRQIFSNVVFQESQRLIDENSGLCSIPGMYSKFTK